MGFYPKTIQKRIFFNLEVGFSKNISLSIKWSSSTKTNVQQKLSFFYGSSKGMIDHFKRYSDWIIKKYGKNINNLIEISNDGTFK